MRICIFGAGAIGSHFAVKLARAGHDVSVIARGPQLEAIRSKGLTLKAGDQSWSVELPAHSDAAELGPQDLVIVAAKATGLAAIVDPLKPLIGPETGVVFPQNGMPWWYPLGLTDKPEPPSMPLFQLADRFLSYLSPEQIIGGSVYSANAMIEPGVVQNNSPARNRMSIEGVSPDCRFDVAGLRNQLEEAGISSPTPDGGIRAIIWSKLLLNMSISGLALVTRNEASISRVDPDLNVILRRILAEGLLISKAHGYPLDDKVDAEATIAQIPDHKPSILQDYELGRPMEIDEIIRAPQAFARAAGVETPSLDVLSAIATRQARDRGLYSG